MRHFSIVMRHLHRHLKKYLKFSALIIMKIYSHFSFRFLADGFRFLAGTFYFLIDYKKKTRLKK